MPAKKPPITAQVAHHAMNSKRPSRKPGREPVVMTKLTPEMSKVVAKSKAPVPTPGQARKIPDPDYKNTNKPAAKKTGRPLERTTGTGKAPEYLVGVRHKATDLQTGQEIKRRLIERCSYEISPLEVMLDAMILFHEDTVMYMHESDMATHDKVRVKYRNLAKSEATKAVGIAKEIAPYIHARLQAVTLKGDPEEPVHLSMYDAETLRSAVRGKAG